MKRIQVKIDNHDEVVDFCGGSDKAWFINGILYVHPGRRAGGSGIWIEKGSSGTVWPSTRKRRPRYATQDSD